MIIRPSKALAENYDEIAETCRQTSEPVFITKNGEGDTVVMDMESYNRREQILELREKLLSIEENRINGAKGFSIDEVVEIMNNAIER